MTTDAIFQEIKKAEERAEQVLADAERDRQKLLADARQKAARIGTDETAGFEKEKQEAMDTLATELNKERAAILKQGAKDAEALRKKAEKNQGKAVELVLEAFTKAVK